jgi:hypothetical protein
VQYLVAKVAKVAVDMVKLPLLVHPFTVFQILVAVAVGLQVALRVQVAQELLS